MRHMNAGRRLGVDTSHRSAMMNNLVTSLMEHGRIRTTEARAKELRKLADRVITLAKRVNPDSLANLQGTELKVAQARRVHAIRLARRWITNRDLLSKIFSEYATRYATRPGGYTRILKLGTRPGDCAKMVLIELVEAYEPKGAETTPESSLSERPASEATEAAV